MIMAPADRQPATPGKLADAMIIGKAYPRTGTALW
jgi:hypothetical protein